jgi:hypothetical protein
MLVTTDSAMKNFFPDMKILSILGLLAASILATTPAGAGAASGMPSPFFPPYPDYGCDARCILRHEAQFQCRTAMPHRMLHHGTAWCGAAK